MRRRANKKPIERLNLIPILDSVFIFIFFLLMSAQFLNTKSIRVQAPSIVNIEEKPEKDPLNLTISLKSNRLILSKGLNNVILGNFKLQEMNKLQLKLIALKKDYPKEETIIIKPESSFPYKKIVQIMDIISAKNDQKLFPIITFEKV